MKTLSLERAQHCAQIFQIFEAGRAYKWGNGALVTIPVPLGRHTPERASTTEDFPDDWSPTIVIFGTLIALSKWDDMNMAIVHSYALVRTVQDLWEIMNESSLSSWQVIDFTNHT